jgi:hypothetical protein
MGGMKRPRFGILVLIAACCLLVVSGVWLLTNWRASIGYRVSARYAQMPPDDKALEEWLKTHPTVVPHTVHVGRKDGNLFAIFIRSETICGRPPFPKLEETCAGLGYGPPSDWKDVEGDVSF